LTSFPRFTTTIPDLSICIATLNSSSYLYLRDCLHSISDQVDYLHWVNAESAPSARLAETPASGARLSFELIIVDNGSTDDTVPMLRSEFPFASRILNGKNDGSARPLNRAIRQSTGHIVLALNPATIVQPGALNELVR
jgi:glycosyltransferase involved in cell wall biosynthesis